VFANLFGFNVVGDWQNGTLYWMSPTAYTDTVGGVAYAIPRIRGFPHVRGGEMSLGQPGLSRPVPWNGQRMRYKNFLLDLECGTANDAAGNPAQVTLRTSVDRGKTFYAAGLQPTGLPGQFQTTPQWLQPAGIARDVVFEIEHQIAGECALLGAWIDAEVLAT
jgi:hypothetical protein